MACSSSVLGNLDGASRVTSYLWGLRRVAYLSLADAIGIGTTLRDKVHRSNDGSEKISLYSCCYDVGHKRRLQRVNGLIVNWIWNRIMCIRLFW